MRFVRDIAGLLAHDFFGVVRAQSFIVLGNRAGYDWGGYINFSKDNLGV